MCGVQEHAVLAGSFNPLTVAHLALVEAALRQLPYSAAWFSLAVRTVDKERPSGACLADRVLMLEAVAQRRPYLGIVLCNHGLYVEQAEALHGSVLTSGQNLTFVVGFDKIVQIFDPRYYQDRDTELLKLFRLAHFLVAPRNAHGVQELAELLEQPENRPFRHAVAPLAMGGVPHHETLSSTKVRETCARGGPIAGLVPPEIERFIAETGLYTSPVQLPDGEAVDRYALRLQVLHALFARPSEPCSNAEFHAVLQAACESSPRGMRLRQLLASAASLDDLRAALHNGSFPCLT